jgi:hypothetical protein
MRSSPWWWRQQGPLKRRLTSTRLHGATTQKTAIFGVNLLSDKESIGYRILVGKSFRERPLERQRRKWEDNIKIDSKRMLYEVGRWTDLAQYYVQWWALIFAVFYSSGCHHSISAHVLLQRGRVPQQRLPEVQWGVLPQAGRRLPSGTSARYLRLLPSGCVRTCWGGQVFQHVSVGCSAPRDQEVRTVWRQPALPAQTGSHLQGELHQLSLNQWSAI